MKYIFYYSLFLCIAIQSADIKKEIAMPKSDQYGRYPTQNNRGYIQPPTDLISQAFFANIINEKEEHNVLDIGCGYGLHALEILQKTDKCNYFGLDASNSHLKIAKVKMKEANLINRWYDIHATFPHVALTENNYHHIGAFNIFHFLKPEEIVPALQLIEKSLSKNGRGYIYTAHVDVCNKAAREYYNERKKQDIPYPGFIDTTTLADLIHEKRTTPSSSENTKEIAHVAAEHYLFFEIKELVKIIKQHTSLKVELSAKIKTANPNHTKCIGIIVHKP